ncbi:MAG: type I restriction-modification system subunit M [Gammaproteobacteria bacterium]|nr:type I restriction-modification system subunit M [Gammaproteobacteria bacterium]
MNDATKKTKLTQNEVNDICWRACDTFRGVIDANEYKDYILVMLFIKYISDVWKDLLEKNKKRCKKDKVRLGRAMKNERFFLPEGASFDSLLEARNADNIGERIDIAIEKIEEKNKNKLTDVFRNIHFNSDRLGETKDRNRLLKTLLEDFADPRLDLRPSRIEEDVIGEAYMYLIERFGSDAGKKAGEFYTPACVRKLVARLAAPEHGALICDPTCGSGSLLIDTAYFLGGNNFRLFGQEKNGSTFALAKMNMFLHRIDDADLRLGDTISNPLLLNKNGKLRKFDRVVANPPFSLDKWGAEDAANDVHGRFARGVPPKSKGDWAFVLHMIETVRNQHGRVVVVVPHGVLFRGGAEGRIREQVLKENLLDAVIGLPAKLFSSAAIPVALLVIDRRREKGGELESRKNVLFVDASQEFVSGRNQITLVKTNIDRILKTVDRRKKVKKFAHLANAKEIAANDYNINIPRYVDTFEEEDEIDLTTVQAEITRLDEDLIKTRARLRTHLDVLGL